MQDDGAIGVYVHVPFCERVCPYCDFAVVAAKHLTPERTGRYVDALLVELGARAPVFEGRRLASLYLGGGTPSLLSEDDVARVVAAVFERFPGADEVEVTLEMNPSTVERSRLPGFRAAGVNRVSLGVQSFDDAILKRLGRAHRAEEARATLSACARAGYANLSLDLIFAAPGQGLAGCVRDLDEAIGHAPAHVSVYELTVEPGTPFATAAGRGQLALPDEDEVAAMHETAERRLGAAGLCRYEISSYARPGAEAVHNRRYWERRPVLGLGVGAFSTDPAGAETPFGVRRSNDRGLDAYLTRVEAGASPEDSAEVLDARTARGEAVFLALRESRGLDAGRFADEFGERPRHFFAAAIDELVAAELLEEQMSGDLRLRPRGRLLADTVFARFV